MILKHDDEGRQMLCHPISGWSCYVNDLPALLQQAARAHEELLRIHLARHSCLHDLERAIAAVAPRGFDGAENIVYRQSPRAPAAEPARPAPTQTAEDKAVAVRRLREHPAFQPQIISGFLP